MRPFLLSLFVLAGCAALPAGAPVFPREARLSTTTLTVGLSDGLSCRADWAEGSASGTFADCPGFGWTVEPVAHPNLLRQLIDRAAGSLGAEGLFAPMAAVTVSAEGRDWRFVSPPPVQ